ncbi:MAG TPA: hypothetical protein VIX59_03505 [Candidatus Binataceae bacterium]
MMQPAKDWNRCDAADLLRPPKIRSISIQGEMGPHLIVIHSVGLQDTAQVRFAEHDEVIERFATDRSDEPFNVRVLPRRAWRRREPENIVLRQQVIILGRKAPSRVRLRNITGRLRNCSEPISISDLSEIGS